MSEIVLKPELGKENAQKLVVWISVLDDALGHEDDQGRDVQSGNEKDAAADGAAVATTGDLVPAHSSQVCGHVSFPETRRRRRRSKQK